MVSYLVEDSTLTNRKNFRVVLDGKIFVEDSKAAQVKTLYFECWDCSFKVPVFCDPRMNFVFNQVQCAQCWKNLHPDSLVPAAEGELIYSNGVNAAQLPGITNVEDIAKYREQQLVRKLLPPKCRLESGTPNIKPTLMIFAEAGYQYEILCIHGNNAQDYLNRLSPSESGWISVGLNGDDPTVGVRAVTPWATSDWWTPPHQNVRPFPEI